MWNLAFLSMSAMNWRSSIAAMKVGLEALITLWWSVSTCRIGRYEPESGLVVAQHERLGPGRPFVQRQAQRSIP